MALYLTLPAWGEGHGARARSVSVDCWPHISGPIASKLPCPLARSFDHVACNAYSCGPNSSMPCVAGSRACTLTTS
eukprot:2156988-Amphidinium_carterae.2